MRDATVPQTVDDYPHNVELEWLVLASILFNVDAQHLVAELSSQDFYDETNASLFDTIKERIEETGGPVSYASLLNYFSENINTPQDVVRRLHVTFKNLAGCAMPEATARSGVRQLKNLSARRLLRLVGEQLILETNRELGDVREAGLTAIEYINNAIAHGTQTREMRLSVATVASSIIDELQAPEPPKPPLWTGLRDLDAVLGGLKRGEVTILAGRPSMGKSALALAIMVNAAKGGFPVEYFSLEMTHNAAVTRILSLLAFEERERAIPFSAILNRRLDLASAEFERIAKAAQIETPKLPYHINAKRGLTALEIGAHARRADAEWKGKTGRGLGLVVIDHLGKITASNRYFGKPTQEMAEKMNAACVMAGDLDVPVLLLAQLNRALESRDEKRPTLPDLREAGNIEEDADNVIFAFREDYYLERTKQSDPNREEKRLLDLQAKRGLFEAIIAKNRNGPCEVVTLACDMAQNAFWNRDSAIETGGF